MTDALSFQIRVKTLSGLTIPLRVSPQDTVEMVKEQIFRVNGMPVLQQRLRIAGKNIEMNAPDATMQFYNLQENSVLQVWLQLKCG